MVMNICPACIRIHVSFLRKRVFVIDNNNNSVAKFFAVIACFLLSGFAALLYETAWMRQFAIVFGTAEFALIAVLSAYMGGLALGAVLGGRFAARIQNPVLVYGLLELGIALFALAVPVLISLASKLQLATLGGQAGLPAGDLISFSFQFVLAFLILLVPTVFMGATLPLLAQHAVNHENQIGSRVGLLYAMNTLGAVAGVLVAAFVLLPKFGLRTTVWFGVATNFVIFLLAVLIARGGIPRSQTQAISNRRENWNWILPLIACSGALAFVYEVLWTRLLSHILGSSIFAFATMLASFLAGISVGSALASRFASSPQRAATGFMVAQVATAITSAGIYLFLDQLHPDTTGWQANALSVGLLLIPATLFIGACFPFAIRLATPTVTGVSHGSAQVYAWNTVGAIVGAMAAGFLIIPTLDFAGTIRFAVFGNVLLAVVATLLLGNRSVLKTATAVALGAIVMFVFQPQRPQSIIQASPIKTTNLAEEHFYSVGRSASVLVTSNGNYLEMRTNGLPEATISRVGTPPVRNQQHWLGVLPVIARAETRDMLIIGLGGGVSLETVPSSVTHIDVVELEREVLRANEEIRELRQVDPLSDKRVNVVINDARSAMSLTAKHYQSIVAQPSHPWTAGASHLYTREFMRLAKSRLSKGGVFVQWMNTNFVNEELLKSLVATLTDVFPHTRLYRPVPETLIFLGSDQPLNLETYFARSGGIVYGRLGLSSLEDLLVALAADDEGLRTLALDGVINTDDKNILATLGGRLNQSVDMDDILANIDPLTNPDSWIYRSFEPDMLYLGQRLHATGFAKRARRLADALPVGPDRWLVAASNLSAEGKQDQAFRALATARSQVPDNPQILYALLLPHLGQIAVNQLSGDAKLLMDELRGECVNVLKALKFAVKQDWKSVVKLDARLGRVRPTQLCYPLAVQLRADWRTQVDPSQQPGLAKDAIALVDSILASYETTELYLIRATAARVAGDHGTFVESTLILANGYHARVSKSDLGDQEREALKVRIQLIADELDKVEFGPGYSGRLRLARRIYRGLMASLG